MQVELFIKCSMTELQGKIHCIQIPILGTNCLTDSSEVTCDFSIDHKSPKSARDRYETSVVSWKSSTTANDGNHFN